VALNIGELLDDEGSLVFVLIDEAGTTQIKLATPSTTLWTLVLLVMTKELKVWNETERNSRERPITSERSRVSIRFV